MRTVTIVSCNAPKQIDYVRFSGSTISLKSLGLLSAVRWWPSVVFLIIQGLQQFQQQRRRLLLWDWLRPGTVGPKQHLDVFYMNKWGHCWRPFNLWAQTNLAQLSPLNCSFCVFFGLLVEHIHGYEFSTSVARLRLILWGSNLDIRH